MANKGTNFTLDLLATEFADEAIVDIGYEDVYKGIQDGLAVHQAEVTQALSFFAEERNEVQYGAFRHARWGENAVIRGRKVDEVGVTNVQKVSAGYTVGFGLDRNQFSVGWSDDFLELTTGAQLLKDFTALRQGDFLDQRATLLNCIFSPTNHTETEDFFDHIDVNVKALINADSSNIPDGPNGETFDGSTHTHYIANNGITNAKMLELATLVKEHYGSGQVYMFINKTNATTVRGLTDFMEYTPMNIIPSQTAERVKGTVEDLPLDDKQIGEIDSCIVWTKPWMPAGYVLAVIVSPRIKKVVRFRRRKGGLYLKANNKSFPLVADFFENNYGAGILERTAAAVLDATNADPGVYVAPTIT